jgi:hypothetical protein
VVLSGVREKERERERERERGEERAGASSALSHITKHSTTSNFDYSFPNNKQRGNIVITKLAVSIF